MQVSDQGIPVWLTSQFETHSGLPKGPLAHFPFPVSSQITQSLSQVPFSGAPRLWTTRGLCEDIIDEVRRFYEEFLFACGYDVTENATRFTPRCEPPFRSPDPEYLYGMLCEDHPGYLTLRVTSEGFTEICVCMGDPTHPYLRQYEAWSTTD